MNPMRWKREILPILAASLFAIASAHAQTTILASGEVGPGYLGFRDPHLAIGATTETKIHRLFLWQQFLISPDVKQGRNRGHDIAYGVTADFNVWHHMGPLVGYSYSKYWSGRVEKNSDVVVDRYSKGGGHPVVGAAILDSWYGAPGRFVVEYHFPSGCVYATASDPCPITSPRTRALTFSQEFELWHKLRLGVLGGWLNYGDQVNPNAPNVPQSRHNTGYVTATVRYELWRQR